MPEFDVLVVGELNVDLIFNQMEAFPVTGKEVLANQMNLTMGSSSAIFASNLSSMGARVAFAGMIGKDSFGDLVISALTTKKVDTRFIFRTNEFNTGATVVMNQDNDRAMLTYPGAMTVLSLNDITDEMLISARHLHVSSIFLQSGLKDDIVALMKRAKAMGMTTSLDPQWDPEEKWDIPWDDLFRFLDVFLPNKQEFLMLTGESEFKAAPGKFRDFHNVIVVKDGTNGAYILQKNELIHQPAFLNPSVIDCIGAGDSFDAGFIYMFLQARPLPQCLQYANLMGALNTTAVGGTGAFENHGTMKQKALKMFNIHI
jgi:sugar/nucleoside kinase (ribokinase family)